MGLPDVVKAIILDVDGTMYNQRRLRLAVGGSLALSCFRRPSSTLRSLHFLRAYRKAQERLRSESGVIDLAARQFQIACERTGIHAAEGNAIIERWFRAAPLAQLRRFVHTGLSQFLEAARSQGISLGVFSDYPADNKLEAMGLSGYFDVVFSASDPEVGRLKPDATGLLLCMARLGASPEQTIYVGDRTDVDVECAVRAGVCPVIVGSPKATTSTPFIGVPGFRDLSQLLFDRTTRI